MPPRFPTRQFLVMNMEKYNNLSETAIFNAENVKKELQEKGEYHSLTRGVSMRPMLRQHKDVVVIVPITSDYKKNDVLLYATKGKNDLVLHRVLKIRENDFVIRGDNTYAYEYIPKENVVGILKEFYRNGKYINCETNKGYRIYSMVITKINFLVKIWYVDMHPILGKVKRFIFRVLKINNR